MSLARLLADVDLFADLPEELRARVGLDMSMVVVAPGRRLFEVGEVGDAAYYVLEGRVHLESAGVVIASRGPGEWVGEFALIDQAPRSATARAVTTARLIRWPQDAFARAVTEHPQVSRGLFRLLTTKLREDVEMRVAHAVEQARWRLEMELARDVQQGLLPGPDAVLGDLELACRCDSAGQVGGDLYDYVALADPGGGAPRAVGVLVGDVTGHGVHSALLAAMAKSCLHNQIHTDARPAAVMRALAGTLELSLGTRLLMSAAYVLVEGCSLVYANAGHPPLLHVRSTTGTVTRLAALDPILGVIEPTAFDAHEAEFGLRRGDLLVLHTDGVIEARNPAGEHFAEDRLEAVLASGRFASAQACRHAVLEAVAAFRQGRALEDDLTLVVVRAQ